MTRRQVTTAAAWSVPVIALAMATPASATSQPGLPIPWEEALLSQWGAPVQNLLIGTTSTPSNIRSQLISTISLYNGSSIEIVPVGSATATISTALRGSGTRLPADALVILEVRYGGVAIPITGAGTTSVSYTNPVEIPMSGVLALQVVWGVKSGTPGVVTTAKYTEWAITGSADAGGGTFNFARVYDYVGTSV